jgi:hydrogenase nickel incorporation protein HypA/HybF
VHELSIALSLVDLACEEAGKLRGECVQTLHIEVGAVSGVVEDALLFSFDVASRGTPIEGARLQISRVAAAIWCDTCRGERELTSVLDRRCPVCSAPAARLQRGTELRLNSIEVAPLGNEDRRGP